MGEDNQQTPENIYKTIKNYDWSNCLVSFYVGNRKFKNKIPYNIYQVYSNKQINDLFLQFLNSFLNNYDREEKERKIIEYDYVNHGDPGALLSTSVLKNKNHSIINNIIEFDGVEIAKQYKLLLKGDFYIIRFSFKKEKEDEGEDNTETNENNSLYAFRRIQSKYNYTPKAKMTLSNLLFADGKLIGLGDEHSFKLDEYFDYISYGDQIFIQSKENFEYILNIREELLQICDTVINKLNSSNIISNSTDFREIIGTNLHYLRKIAKVESCNYYSDKNYVKKMLDLIKKKNHWNIQLDGEKIQVTKENVNNVFSVLMNNRLKSDINGEEFDTEIKHPLKQ